MQFIVELGPTSQRLIKSSDIQWLGVFKVPTVISTDVSGLAGTRRAVNGGRLTFLTLGNTGTTGNGQLLYEFDYPGYASSLATAPRAGAGGDGLNPLTRSWGDMTTTTGQTNSHMLQTDGTTDFVNMAIKGITWDPTQNLLFWGYGLKYNQSRYTDPNYGACALDDSLFHITAYGPWRTLFQGSPGASQMHHHLLIAPTSFANTYLGGRRQVLGGDWYGGLLTLNYGPSLHSPSVNLTPTTPVYSPSTPNDIATSDLIHYVWTGTGGAQDQPVNAPGQGVTQCAGVPSTCASPDKTAVVPRTGNYIIHPDTNAVPATAEQHCSDNYGTGLTGYAGRWDGTDGASNHRGTSWFWIDTPTRFGALQFTRLGIGHCDYAPSTPCCHGVRMFPLTTGPMAQDAQAPVVYIFDPAVFADVLNNHANVTLNDGISYPKTWRAPSEVKDLSATGFIHAWDQVGTGPSVPTDGIAPNFIGSYYDDVTGLCFLMCDGTDNVGGSYYPVVNVFKIN